MITTQQAVMSLRPGAEWSMNGDDVEGIIWHTEGVQTAHRKRGSRRSQAFRAGRD
jgi:hypothetical protein